MTRKHIHEEVFPVDAATLFAILHTPSAIRQWWSANRVIVLAQPGGFWTATWGDSEDDPDYISTAAIQTFEPDRRMVLSAYRYHAKSGPLPFEPDFVTEFLVEPREAGAMLRVTQDGFPDGPEADDFYKGCEVGWRDTFAGIRRFFEENETEQ